jgi:GWxTD domain-containing protein
MSFSHSTIHAAVLLFPLCCAEPILAQEDTHHPCFEQPNGAKEAIHRLPESARYWLAEDAVYIITPEERCGFLHLKTDQEREQFIEQFWYRRTVNPASLDYDFKTEHYRRIVFANEKYGGHLAGWKTDRGRIYVLFGPPDSVDLVAGRRAAAAAPNQDSDTYLHPAEKWHYSYIKDVGENVEFHFEYVAGRTEYALAAADQNLLERADLNPNSFPVTSAPKIRFKDLEALIVSRIVRDQVKLRHRIEFAAATHATTLARMDIQIPCAACIRDGQVVPSIYPLFIRVSKPGWVVHDSELTTEIAVPDRSDSLLTLTAHLDVPLAPGTYQLAIAAKNAATGEAGVLRTQLDVPTYESLGTKN